MIDYEGPVRIGEVPFGSPDPELCKLLCKHIEDAMPATMVKWRRGTVTRLKSHLRSLHLQTEIGEDPNAIRSLQSLRGQANAGPPSGEVLPHTEVPPVWKYPLPD